MILCSLPLAECGVGELTASLFTFPFLFAQKVYKMRMLSVFK